MKKFTKLFLSCAAAAALTAAVATSAMAAEGDVDLKGAITGIYNAGTLTLTAPNDEDAIKTVVVLDAEGADEDANTVKIQNKNVIGIDQVTENTIVVKLDTAKVDTVNKKYTVLVGGSAGQIYEATFGGPNATASYGQVTLGDTDIDFEDAVLILKYELNKATLTDEQKLNANIVDIEAGEIDFEDAVDILKYELDKPCELKKLLGEE